MIGRYLITTAAENTNNDIFNEIFDGINHSALLLACFHGLLLLYHLLPTHEGPEQAALARGSAPRNRSYLTLRIQSRWQIKVAEDTLSNVRGSLEVRRLSIVSENGI